MSTKKRVRFSLDANQTREYDPDAAEAEEPPAKRASTGLDPMQLLEGQIGDVCIGGSGGDLDAGQAASIRAACRRNQLIAAFEEGTEAGEGLEEGEEDYEDPEEMFDSVTGVPIEPFHLKREREEGYFDENGCFVEFKRQLEPDAWADELANVEVDEEWLARVMGGRGRQAAEAAAAAGEAPDMPAEEIARLKRRVMDLLLPGESVLQALRRLAAVRPQAGGGSGGAPGSPASSDPLARHPRALRTQAMPAAVQEKFEALTELSSVLMDQGVYGVHSMTREQLERSLEPPAAGPSGGAAAAPGSPPAAAGPAAGGGGGGDAGQQLAERLLAGAAGHAQPANGSSGGGSSGEGEAAAAGAQPQRAAVDADLEDIFGGEEPAAPAEQAPQQAQQSSRGGSGDGQPTGGAQEPAAPLQRDASGDVAMQDEQQPAVAQQGSGDGGGGAQEQPADGPPPAAAAAAAAAGQELDGFVLDSATGYLYNSDLGCYYNPESRLFGDSATGQWWRFDADSGQYTLAG